MTIVYLHLLESSMWVKVKKEDLTLVLIASCLLMSDRSVLISTVLACLSFSFRRNRLNLLCGVVSTPSCLTFRIFLTRAIVSPLELGVTNGKNE